jgi:hypothetical protein
MAIKPTSKTIVTAGTDAGLVGIDHAAHTAILANSKGNTASYNVITDKAVYVTNVIENNTTAFVKNDAVDNPGGTQGQFQYNDNGNLAGVPGMTYSPNGVVSVNNLSVNNFNIPGGVAGQVLGTTGGAVTWVAAGPEVAGSNGQVQFNDAGDLGASPAFTFNKTSNTMIAGNIATNRVNGLVTARITALSDATNKEYVDGIVGDLAADVADIDSKVVYSVNGITPINGNVPVNLVGTQTGTALPPRPTPVNGVTDGVVFIISGTGTDADGTAYIFSNPTNGASTGTWLEISPPGQASSDLRYVNLSGDTMSGSLILGASQMTGATDQHAATKGYVDSVMGSSTLVGLTDVEFNVAPVADQILKYDGFKWVNSPAPSMNATNITVTQGGNITSTNVQAALTELDSKKVSKSGDTMTGALNINVAPTPASNNAATTNYVDSKVGSAIGNVLSGVTPLAAGNVSFTPGSTISATNVQDALLELGSEKVAKAGDTMSGLLILSGAPTDSLGAATKSYVDDKIAPQSTVTVADAGKAPKLGINGRLDLSAMAEGLVRKVNGVSPDADGEVTVNIVATITGDLAEFESKTPPPVPPGGQRDGIMFIVSGETGDPTQNGSVYIWSDDAGGAWLEISPPGTESNDVRYLRTSGGSMTGNINMANRRIVGVPVPNADDHAVNKVYVDDIVDGINTNITNLNNGLSGKVAKAGDTMTGTLNVPTINVTANATLGAVGNVHISGGSAGQFLQTNGFGNLAWASVSGAASGITVIPGGNITSTNVQAAITELDSEKVRKSGDTMSGFLILNADPETALGAATRQYVDAVNATAFNALNIASSAVKSVNSMRPDADGDVAVNFVGTATGFPLPPSPTPIQGVTDGVVFIISGDPESNDLLNTNGQAFIWSDDAINPDTGLPGTWLEISPPGLGSTDARYLSLSGGTMSGNIVMAADTKITGLPEPNVAGDAVNKAYVDNKFDDIDTSITAAQGAISNLQNGKVAKVGDTMSGFLNLHADPTANLHAATKQYVDGTVKTSEAKFVEKAGSTMTGTLTLDPTEQSGPNDAATIGQVGSSITTALNDFKDFDLTAANVKVSILAASLAGSGVTNVQGALEFVADSAAGKVAKIGDTMTGHLTLNADPTADLHAATKKYVDTKAQGLKPGAASRVATGTNINLAGTFIAIDGVTLADEDRVLVKDQTTKSENGIYVYDSGTQQLSRAADFNNATNIVGGYLTFIKDGTLGGTQWVSVIGAGFTLGNDIVFEQFSGAQSLTGGTGIEVDGTEIKNTGVVQIVNGTGISVAPVSGNGTVTVTNTGVTSITGVAGNVTVTGGPTGAVTIDLPSLVNLGPTSSLTATHLIGEGGNIANIQASNIVGTIATASTVTTAAQPNITSVGTLTSLTVSGVIQGGTFTGNANGLSSIQAANIVGVLPILHGGTGATTATAAFNALSPTTTGGDTIYHNGTDDVRLPIGTAGQVLTVAANSRPTWSDPAADAANISSIASGNIIATTVQAAITELDSKKLPLAGGTMTGDLILNNAPYTGLGDGLRAVTKAYVDAAVSGATPGGTLVTLGTTPLDAGDTVTEIDGLTAVTADTFTGNLAGNVIGNVTGNVTGTASNATSLVTAQNFSITGDVTTAAAVSFNGTGPVALATTLADLTSTAGGTFQKFTRDSKGRVSQTTAVVSADITTALGYTPVNKAGDEMTGPLAMGTNKITGLGAPEAGSADAATALYVDTGLGTKLNLAGGTLTGKLTLDADPTADLHAATKKYVDSKAAGITPGDSCRVATSDPITLTGPGATISGITLTNGDRVLVKDQVDKTTNGIYVFNGDSSPMTRPDDFSTTPTLTIANGFTTFIVAGTQSGTTWISANMANPYAGGNINFTQFGGAATLSGGTGILFATNTITNDGVLTVAAGAGMSATGVGSGPYKGAVTVTNTGVLSLAGVTNQINVSSSTGTVTLSLPSTVNLGAGSSLTATTLIGEGGNISNVQAGNVIGTVSSATTSTTAGTVTTAAQPNITSVGTLVGLNVTGGTGIVTATTFAGSGANLTNLPAGNITGTVDSATTAGTLATPRSIAMGGASSDGTWTVSFNGSSDVTGAMTLKNTGTPVTGQFVKISTDAAGRVSATTPVVAADITGLIGTPITSVTALPDSGIGVSQGGSTSEVLITNAGVTSIVDGVGIKINQGTGTVTIDNDGIIGIDAGTGITVGPRQANGHVLISSTATGGVTALAGAGGQITATDNGSGSFTLSIPNNPTLPGNVSATGFIGNGAQLTNLNASNITTGVLPITSGGTGETAATAAFKALAPVAAASGDMMYYNGADWVKLDRGNPGFYLSMNAGGTAPVWVALATLVLPKTNAINVDSGVINCDSSTYFETTVASGTRAFSIINAPAAPLVFDFTLEIIMNGGAVTWPASVRWPGGIPPSITVGRRHLFMFSTRTGGSIWYGTFLTDFPA